MIPRHRSVYMAAWLPHTSVTVTDGEPHSSYWGPFSDVFERARSPQAARFYGGLVSYAGLALPKPAFNAGQASAGYGA